MSNEDLKKSMRTLGQSVSEGMQEGLERIRVLKIEPTDVAMLATASDKEIKDFVKAQDMDFGEHYIRLKTNKSQSEGFMKTPEEIRQWLKITSAN